MALCKTCHGEGGFFDCGWWYECPTCQPRAAARQLYRSKEIIDTWKEKAKANNQTVVAKWPEEVQADQSKFYARQKESIKHPDHYNKHKSGIECIDVVQHMGFNLGNAVKYIWRADLKNDAIEDMKKAIQYLEFEIEKRCKNSHLKN